MKSAKNYSYCIQKGKQCCIQHKFWCHQKQRWLPSGAHVWGSMAWLRPMHFVICDVISNSGCMPVTMHFNTYKDQKKEDWLWLGKRTVIIMQIDSYYRNSKCLWRSICRISKVLYNLIAPPPPPTHYRRSPSVTKKEKLSPEINLNNKNNLKTIPMCTLWHTGKLIK